MLIHQAIEAYMKASICLTTPLLLIEEKKTEWPVLPKQRDKPFDNLYTLQAETLLYIFFATAKRTYNEGIQEHINEIRKLRNQIVHGISKQKLSPKSLLINILYTYTFFVDKDTWWDEMRNFHLDHPLNEGMDFESLETNVFVERLDYTCQTIGISNLAKHFSVDLKARKYLCPACLPIDKELGKKFDYKWAFLSPNQADSTLISCVNCSTSCEVERIQCPRAECPGNVIWEDYLCMTCGENVSAELSIRAKNTAVVEILENLIKIATLKEETCNFQ